MGERVENAIVSIGWLVDLQWLAGCLLDDCWLAAGWLLVGWWLIGCCWLVAGWLLTGLVVSWLLLGHGWLMVGVACYLFMRRHNIHAQAQHSCACTNFCAQLPFQVPYVVPGPRFGARGKARMEHVVPKKCGCGQECCAAEGEHLTGDHLRLMYGHGSANYVRTYVHTYTF